MQERKESGKDAGGVLSLNSQWLERHNDWVYMVPIFMASMLRPIPPAMVIIMRSQEEIYCFLCKIGCEFVHRKR